MMKLIFNTEDNWGITLVRLMLGIVLFPHGAQKMFGWFGGYGFTGTMEFFTDTMNIPYAFGLLAIVVEFAGALLLIFGFAARITSMLVFFQFLVIIFTSHLDFGFFMNWFGNQKGEGYEYHLLVLAMSGAMVLAGAGAWSIDSFISKRSASSSRKVAFA